MLWTDLSTTNKANHTGTIKLLTIHGEHNSSQQPDPEHKTYFSKT